METVQVKPGTERPEIEQTSPWKVFKVVRMLLSMLGATASFTLNHGRVGWLLVLAIIFVLILVAELVSGFFSYEEQVETGLVKLHGIRLIIYVCNLISVLAITMISVLIEEHTIWFGILAATVGLANLLSIAALHPATLKKYFRS